MVAGVSLRGVIDIFLDRLMGETQNETVLQSINEEYGIDFNALIHTKAFIMSSFLAAMLFVYILVCCGLLGKIAFKTLYENLSPLTQFSVVTLAITLIGLVLMYTLVQ